MQGMWIQLLGTKYIDIDGKARGYFPGDWVQVGRQTALAWIAAGEARAARPVTWDLPSGSGVVLRTADGDAARAAASHLGRLTRGLEMAVSAEPALPYDLTLLWEPSLSLRLELVPAGLGFVQDRPGEDAWQIAAPLHSYSEMAGAIGSREERAATEAVIGDLRVPVYDTRLLFVRRCSETEDLIGLWRAERGEGDERLAFLRALWRVPALLLPLPTTWTGKG